MQGPQPGSLRGPVRTQKLALWGPPEACLIICSTNIWVCCSSVCVRVCKAPKQMVGDVRLRHTIDFRKQISSLVKQKAPLGHREGKREGETGGMGRRRRRRRLSNLCHHQLCERKPGKNKHVREEKRHLLNFITAAGKRGRRKEERRVEGKERTG